VTPTPLGVYPVSPDQASLVDKPVEPWLTVLDSEFEPVANSPKVAISADGEAKRSAQPNANLDRVLNKAKATISAKIDEDPSSIELVGLKRGIRKNTLGVPLDTICGYVKEKAADGNDGDQKPFLYLVKENDAYVVNGASDVTASAAYHNICN
jgi:hypothetical protein